MPVLIEARGLTEQTAAEKTHGLQSATRDRVLGNVRKAEEGMQAHRGWVETRIRCTVYSSAHVQIAGPIRARRRTPWPTIIEMAEWFEKLEERKIIGISCSRVAVITLCALSQARSMMPSLRRVPSLRHVNGTHTGTDNRVTYSRI